MSQIPDKVIEALSQMWELLLCAKSAMSRLNPKCGSINLFGDRKKPSVANDYTIQAQLKQV
jgi:hypothetical protein